MTVAASARVAIVTGASRGIGRAIATSLSQAGYRLVLVARSDEALHEVATSMATDTVVCPLDLRETDAAAQVVARAVENFGRLDALVNNAGATPRGDFLEFSDEDWQDGFALKFFGAVRLCRAAWPHLRQTQGGIVNIAGIGGRTGNAGFTIGGSVNAALLNLTKALADRGVHDGVRVNAVNPGSIATERMRTRIDRLAAEQGVTAGQAADELARQLRVARFGMPEEVANVVAFLLSEAASYMQGAIVDVDGGQTRTL
jgi:NAD(P)-dependent dehydrogenase (short-subunit alcohol dehydrogenase family)